MATHLRTALVIEALEMAVAQRRPDAVVHHSDQGCQSLAFGARCRKWGVAQSMGSVGDLLRQVSGFILRAFLYLRYKLWVLPPVA